LPDAPGPVVSVNIPCYKQLDLARRSVGSILAQSLREIEVTLLDDGASDEYRQWVESLGDPRLVYRRNPERLGAMRNMFAAISAGRAPYTIAFHEDDLMGRHYLQAAVRIFADDPTCAFVACQMREFDTDLTDDELGRGGASPAFSMFTSSADFVRGIVRGAEPMFGSVVYRRSALSSARADHDALQTLVDRPFLMSILDAGWHGAIVEEPLVWYRHHGDGDTRHLAMTSANILRLLRIYRDALPDDWSNDDRTAYFKYSGYWLFEQYRMTPPANRPRVWRFQLDAWRQGVYSPRARGNFGVRQILRALVNQTSVL